MGKVKGSMDGFGKTQETVVTYRGNNRKKSAVFGINKKRFHQRSSHMTESRGGEKKNTHQNNDNQSPIRLLDLERKRNQEDSHRIKSLEHLDKRDAQSKIGIVGQDERAGEKGADGEDGSHPLLPL